MSQSCNAKLYLQSLEGDITLANGSSTALAPKFTHYKVSPDSERRLDSSDNVTIRFLDEGDLTLRYEPSTFQGFLKKDEGPWYGIPSCVEGEINLTLRGIKFDHARLSNQSTANEEWYAEMTQKDIIGRFRRISLITEGDDKKVRILKGGRDVDREYIPVHLTEGTNPDTVSSFETQDKVRVHVSLNENDPEGTVLRTDLTKEQQDESLALLNEMGRWRFVATAEISVAGSVSSLWK
ncbi:uncharacterized protein I303_100349 [Kwoniella dejecticola CBS 10117]|uniref:Uncharacterized protein n=1 Tax=Kwoniella dejecticola CBS 10117 TaxID=1296121 RepID=A0A1A6AEN5_9TREE|nr:uncharacterized protein I303_00349 [Kwoniella dejecticola CBS 10117]OBR88532.1 hypothetical protein I303_00349 [Kwoniella dejecticola CBS 10117]